MTSQRTKAALAAAKARGICQFSCIVRICENSQKSVPDFAYIVRKACPRPVGMAFRCTAMLDRSSLTREGFVDRTKLLAGLLFDRIKPNAKDLQYVSLPRMLAPAVWLLRPMRLSYGPAYILRLRSILFGSTLD
jgi:hypothetical protein